MTCLQRLWHSLACTARRKWSGEKQQGVAQKEYHGGNTMVGGACATLMGYVLSGFFSQGRGKVKVMGSASGFMGR